MASKVTLENRLPGDLSKEEYINRLIRVDHAGEYGAKQIYAGQMAVLKNSPSYPTIKHMAEQEEEHLKFFSEEIIKRRVRPTALQPLWQIAGFALGAVTALMGEKAAMACTVAVEEVIDEHYQQQLNTLGDDEKELKQKIEKFRQDEIEHKETGLAHNAEQTTGYPILRAIIRNASKVAIEIAKRI